MPSTNATPALPPHKTSPGTPCTTAMTFIDTNIVLYAVCADAADRAKSGVARAILRRDYLALSVQVLQEFYVQATRPTRTQPLSHEEATALVRLWQRFHIQENTVALLNAALAARHRFQLSFWDAAILEAARAAGCRELLSEDFSAGQDYDGLRVSNQFAV